MSDDQQADALHGLRVLVVGGGTMGAGIAQTFLQSDAKVCVREVDEPAAERTRNTISAGLARWARRTGREDQIVASMDRLQLVVGDASASTDAALIVESVPEDLALKRSILAQLAVAYPDAVLTTNTSALSIDVLALSVTNPGRFVGLHFFNPVPVSGLVEVVRGSATARATIDRCRRWAEALGKRVIEVRDSPGFATSRLGITVGLEAIRMVQEHVASVADIDAGMVLGYRFPIGPLELSDRVGLDVRLAIADDLFARLGPRFEPPALLRQLVADGHLGAKSGRGFYRWDASGHPIPPS